MPTFPHSLFRNAASTQTHAIPPTAYGYRVAPPDRMLAFAGTYHIPVTFFAQTIEFVPPPQFYEETSLVIPPVFGSHIFSPEPTAVADGLVLPLVFGGLTVTPGSPDDEPPDEPPPPPDQDPYGPPDGRPVVDSGDAIPGADRTGRSAAVRVSRVRVRGG